jgi:signal transduction histidine kinase
VRDTLSLEKIWQIVTSEKGVNGNGSYAFILDERGVRIVDPKPEALFTSIAPLSADIEQSVIDENLYGMTSGVRVMRDPTLSSIQNQKNPPTTFQEVPAGTQETFQITRRQLSSVPWTYFVLTPVNEVVAVANQQLLIIAAIAASILLPVAAIGWLVGNRISSPISSSVASLVRDSQILNQLAEREQTVSTEQLWMLEASKTGLKSQQYYTDAAKQAAQHLNELGWNLLHRRDVDRQAVLNTVTQMVNLGQYFEKAIAHQEEANNKVAIAIRVTDEVAEQLASGAKSASEAATELDGVVRQLSQIVGN